MFRQHDCIVSKYHAPSDVWASYLGAYVTDNVGKFKRAYGKHASGKIVAANFSYTLDVKELPEKRRDRMHNATYWINSMISMTMDNEGPNFSIMKYDPGDIP